MVDGSKLSEKRLVGRRHLTIDESKTKSEFSTAASRTERELGLFEEMFATVLTKIYL